MICILLILLSDIIEGTANLSFIEINFMPYHFNFSPSSPLILPKQTTGHKEREEFDDYSRIL